MADLRIFWARGVTARGGGGICFSTCHSRRLPVGIPSKLFCLTRLLGRITSKKKGGPALNPFCCFRWRRRRRPYCTQEAFYCGGLRMLVFVF